MNSNTSVLPILENAFALSLYQPLKVFAQNAIVDDLSGDLFALVDIELIEPLTRYAKQEFDELPPASENETLVIMPPESCSKVPVSGLRVVSPKTVLVEPAPAPLYAPCVYKDSDGFFMLLQRTEKHDTRYEYLGRVVALLDFDASEPLASRKQIASKRRTNLKQTENKPKTEREQMTNKPKTNPKQTESKPKANPSVMKSKR